MSTLNKFFKSKQTDNQTIGLDVTLYQYDTKGKIREWNIKVVHVDNMLSNIVVNAGLQDGAKVETITPIKSGSNIGKANEKSIQEQAEFDAQSEINKKIKKGYVEDIANIKAKDETATIKDPMKGYAYSPNVDKFNKKDKRLTLDDLGIRGKEIYTERKLDGWRLRIEVDADDITFYTSSGDVTLEFPQIAKSIRKSFDKIKDYIKEKYGVEKYYLDGEVYRHELNLIKEKVGKKEEIVGYHFIPNTSGYNATASATASVKNITPIKQELRDLMQFHLFDVCLDAPIETRKKVLEYFYSDTVIKVEYYKVKADDKLLEEMFEGFLAEGYEGLMIRKLGMPYEYKRTKQLTKYKPLEDSEFQIVGFNESIEGNTLGSFNVKLDDGQISSCTLKDEIGTDAMKLEIWNNKEEYLGKWVTVEFMGYTPDGLLRHGRAKNFRKGKSLD